MERIPFSQQIAYLEKGGLDADATESLAEVVMAVTATRKPGQLSITLGLRYDETSKSIEITSAVKATLPKPNRRKTVLFPNRFGELVRDDPEQQPLFWPTAKEQPSDETIHTQETRANE